MLNSLKSLLNTDRSSANDSDRLILVRRDDPKEARQLQACSTKPWPEIWLTSRGQAVQPIRAFLGALPIPHLSLSFTPLYSSLNIPGF